MIIIYYYHHCYHHCCSLVLIKVPEAGVCYIDEAMVAITGMISQNAFFGTTGPSMWLPGSSAFEGAEGFPSDEGLDAGNSHLTHLIRCLFLVVLVNYFFDSLN